MGKKPATDEELLERGADLLADIFVEQIIKKYSQSEELGHVKVYKNDLNN